MAQEEKTKSQQALAQSPDVLVDGCDITLMAVRPNLWCEIAKTRISVIGGFCQITTCSHYEPRKTT